MSTFFNLLVSICGGIGGVGGEEGGNEDFGLSCNGSLLIPPPNLPRSSPKSNDFDCGGVFFPEVVSKNFSSISSIKREGSQ